MQGNDNMIKEFENTFIECINKFQSKRSDLKGKATNAYMKEKSDINKFCLLVGKEIIESKKKYYEENIFFKDPLRNNLVKVLNDALKKNFEYKNFISELCNVSKIIEFIYKISELYSKLFDDNKNEKLFEYFVKFLFRKRYDENLINKIGNIYEFNSFSKITYNDFIQMISSSYMKKNDILNEYIKIFLLNGQNKEEEILVINSKIQEKLKEKNEDKSFKANISFFKPKENKSSFKNGKNEKTNSQIKVFYNNESNSNKSSKKSELIIEKENNNNILSSKELSNEIEKKNNFNFSKFFIINYKVIKIHYLRLNISFLLNNMKINKKNIEQYNQ